MGRYLPPAGTPLRFGDFLSTIGGLFAAGSAEKLEADICQLTGATTAITANSGRAALTLALQAIRAGDARREVILPGYTCFTVPSAVRKAGLRARLVDFAPQTMQYDLHALEALETSDVLAIVLIYPFALYADPEPLLDWARRRKIFVIEDVAQGMGLRHNGKFLGTLGDIGIFSLSKGKCVTSVRGGIAVTSNTKLALSLRALAKQSLSQPSLTATLKVIFEAAVLWLFLSPARFGFIARLPFVTLGETVYDPEFSLTQMPRTAAALARRKLAELDSINDARTASANKLLPMLQPGLTQAKFTVPPETQAVNSRFLRLPIMVQDSRTRDALLTSGKALGLSRMYGEPLSVIDDPLLWGNQMADAVPHATDLAHRLVTLPTHAYVTEDDMRTIAALVNE